MLCRLLLICAGMTSLGLAAMPVQAVELQPGLWEVTSKTARGGVVKVRPTKTRCITPEQVKEFVDRATYEKTSTDQSCKSADLKQAGDKMSWRIQCTGKLPMETNASYTFDSLQHYTALFSTTVTIMGQSASSTLTVEGRRIDECPK
jgi:Protein of unknown function (DUF3617)